MKAIFTLMAIIAIGSLIAPFNGPENNKHEYEIRETLTNGGKIKYTVGKEQFYFLKRTASKNNINVTLWLFNLFILNE